MRAPDERLQRLREIRRRETPLRPTVRDVPPARRSDFSELRLHASQWHMPEFSGEIAVTIKPLSTYPEARDELLKLCKGVEDGNSDRQIIEAGSALAEQVKAILEDEAFGEALQKADADALDVLLTPRHIDEWHEDIGQVLWWTFPVSEAPYIGSPLECARHAEIEIADDVTLTIKDAIGGWPEYHEWFTPLPTNDHIGLIQKRIEVAAAKRSEAQS
jgi:hypothetical protein